MPVIPDVDACLFDAYGTLFDVHSAATRAADALGPAWEAVSEGWRSRQLQYTWLRSLMRRHADFDQVTAEALDYALEAAGLGHRPDLRDRLLDLYGRLDPYPEVPETLRRLRAAGIRTAILSNGTPASLERLAEHAGIADLLDAVISVEAVGVFKPDPRVYALGEAALGVPIARSTFQTSNAWDAHGAASAGLRVVWCNRAGQPPERLPGVPTVTLPSLAELPDLLR